MKRIKGYVVGYDRVGGELVWTVKVKDPSSEHDQAKFSVASTRQGTMLTRSGVNVTFRVQAGESGHEKVLRAVDVNIGSQDPEESPIMERVPKSLTFAVTSEGERIVVWHSECATVGDAEKLYLGEGQQDHVLGLIDITPELILEYGGAISDEEAVAGLATIRQMAYLDPIRDVLCALVATAFNLGKQTQNKTNVS